MGGEGRGDGREEEREEMLMRVEKRWRKKIYEK